MTKQQAISALFQTYGKENETQRAAIYVGMLHDVPDEILEKVIVDCIGTEKFLPPVATIREKALSIANTMFGGKKEKEWDQVWDEIESNLRNVGPYRTPQWSSPEIKQVVSSVGWYNLCETQDRAMPAVKAQMRDAYNALLKRKHEDEHNRNLLKGVSEFEALQANTLKGIGGN